jgi:FlaA1/EpsC-like NDP-sugar epimerase
MQKFLYDPYSALNQRIIDALLCGTSFGLAYQVRFDWHIPAGPGHQMWVLLIPVMVSRLVFNSLLGTYRMVWRYTDLSDAITLTRNQSLFSLILLAVRYGTPRSFENVQIPLSIILVEGLLCLIGSLSVRAMRRLSYEGVTNGTKGIPVLLVGAGRAGVMVAKELKSRSDLHLLGFLDDDLKKAGAVICGLHVLGALPTLSLQIQLHHVQQVIVCLPRPPHGILTRIWAVCEHFSVRVRIVPTLDEILQGRVNIAAFRDVQMQDLLGRDAIDVSVQGSTISEAYSDKSILVTGAGGSIGSELACQLARFKPRHLILLDKDENGLHDTYLRLKGNGDGVVTPVVADVRFPLRIRSIFSSFRPEVIFHAAAHKHVHLMEVNPCEAIANNVIGTRNLVEQAITSGVSRFVQVSTDKAVNPTSIMGASKRLCEMIVQSSQDHHQTQFCCVRFGNVLGSRGSVVPIFQQQIVRGGPVTVTHPGAQRFLMTIPEAVCLLIQAGTLANGGEIFVLDMGEPVFIEHLARSLIEHSGLRPDKDVRIEITQMHPGEKLSEILLDDTTEILFPTQFSKIGRISSQPFDTHKFGQKLIELEEASWEGSAEHIYNLLGELDIGFRSQRPAAALAGKPAEASRAVGV